jgi:hypothetical protein
LVNSLAHRTNDSSSGNMMWTLRFIALIMILLIFRTFLYLIFVLVLGSTCERTTLLSDYMIAAKVSALRKYHLFICFKFILQHVTTHHGHVCSSTASCLEIRSFRFHSGLQLCLQISLSPSRQMTE